MRMERKLITLQLELSANFWSYFDTSGKEKKFPLVWRKPHKSSYQTQIGSIIPSMSLTDSFKLPFYLSFPALQIVLVPVNLLEEWIPLEHVRISWHVLRISSVSLQKLFLLVWNRFLLWYDKMHIWHLTYNIFAVVGWHSGINLRHQREVNPYINISLDIYMSRCIIYTWIYFSNPNC